MPERSRAPHGARGLKQLLSEHKVPLPWSRPAWGAWIETSPQYPIARGGGVAPRMGRVD